MSDKKINDNLEKVTGGASLEVLQSKPDSSTAYQFVAGGHFVKVGDCVKFTLTDGTEVTGTVDSFKADKNKTLVCISCPNGQSYEVEMNEIQLSKTQIVFTTK